MRTQPERNIADTEAGVDSREFLLDGPQRLQRLDSRLSELFIAGAEGECQGIKDEVMLGKPETLRCEAMNPAGDLQLPPGSLRHALLINGECDHRCAVFLAK